MSLPILTTEEDVQAIVDYLKTKVTGATITEAKAVLTKTVLDSRKIGAYVTWGFISKEGDHIKLNSLGRDLSRTKPENKFSIYAQVLRNIKPYRSALEWMFHQRFDQVTNVDVAAHWHEYYKSELGTDKETTIKDMAVCFFRLCQAGGLGQLVIGRKGQSTRFEISKEDLGQYIGEVALTTEVSVAEGIDEKEPEEKPQITEEEKAEVVEPSKPAIRPRIFISHGKNMEIVEQIKTMLELAGLDYEVAEEEETTAIPVPEKNLSAMRKCTAAVICVTADENEKRGNATYGINQNVLIEIGSAFVLYDKKVVLVWDKRVAVPSNLQGLYRCEFSGDGLSWDAGTKLMKALSKFKAKTAGA